MTKSLLFVVEARCGYTRARAGTLRLRKTYGDEEGWVKKAVLTPVFMPVGTNGVMKGLLPEQVEAAGCSLMLSNTYHLAIRPGGEVIEKAGGLHTFMRWENGLLTDSGGFQMVSLSRLMEVDEEGVRFTSPFDENSLFTLPPEESIRVQGCLGSNIIMQLDDVVSSTLNDDERYEEATHRTVRWLDRCLGVQKNQRQSLFPIIQGGLNRELREECVEEMVKRDTPGIAIGGLSGGEEKEKFIETVALSTENLPEDKPRYLMGVGYTVDLLLSSALGCDMFDCVFPTRTARFGSALVHLGSILHLTKKQYSQDPSVLDSNCDCVTCSTGITRAYLNFLLRSNNQLACHYLTQHNIRFQIRFMSMIRSSIIDGKFKDFIFKTLDHHYHHSSNYPDFVKKALNILNISGS